MAHDVFILDPAQGSIEDANAETQIRSALKQVINTAGGSRKDGIPTRVFQQQVDAKLDAAMPRLLQLAGIQKRKVDRTDSYRFDNTGVEIKRDNVGTLGAGALRHVYNEVLTEERPVPNGLALFPVDTTVQLGAKSHEVHRLLTTGDVRVWRGTNAQTGTVNMAQTSKDFPVRYYVTKILWDVFEEIADSYANLGRLQNLMRAAIEIVEAFANNKVWYGDDDNGIFGILNYPYITRLVLNGPGAWSMEQDTSSIDTHEYLRELVRFVTYPTTQSKQAFRPDRLAISQKIATFLQGTWLQLPGHRDTMTLMDAFFRLQSVITSMEQVDVVWELDDCLGPNVSGILLYRRDRMTVANVIPGGDTQTLPIVDQGYVKWQPLFLAHGGVVIRRTGDVALAFAQTTPGSFFGD